MTNEEKSKLNTEVLRADSEIGEWTFTESIWEVFEEILKERDSQWLKRIEEIVPEPYGWDVKDWKRDDVEGDSAQEFGFDVCRQEILNNLAKYENN